MEIQGGRILGHATTVEVYEENSSFPAGVYRMRTGRVSVGYGALTLWVIHPHLKAWLMILTPQILRRHGSPLQSEVYMELTQLELMINDICWGPPGTHLSKIKVFLNALSLACVSLCNELCWPLKSVEGDGICCSLPTSPWQDITAESNIITGTCRHNVQWRGLQLTTIFIVNYSGSQKWKNITSDMESHFSVSPFIKERTAVVNML